MRPYVDIAAALEGHKGTNVKIGAENCHWAKSGAFTGEISAEMLKACGVEYVITGHSETPPVFRRDRRHRAASTAAALDAGLTVIVCVGASTSSSASRASPDELVAMQTKIALGGVTEEELKRIIIAYEPGLGHRHRQDRHRRAGERGLRRDPRDDQVPVRRSGGRAMTIQYGGSMNASNAAELLAQPDVDGGLIGGASLKPADFAAIVEAAGQVTDSETRKGQIPQFMKKTFDTHDYGRLRLLHAGIGQRDCRRK